MNEVFALKTKIHFGNGSLAALENLRNKKILIVTDPYMIESGMINQVSRYLSANDYMTFTDIVPDPPIEVIVNGVEQTLRYQPNIILALGGGSAIDAAKSIMDFAKKIGNLQDLSFIAIPTTSGTGSEVTSFAVITDKEKGIKYPLVSDDLLPDEAILDPTLVASLPGGLVADTGMDVLTHALEAYVSTKATAFSDAFAEKAVSLVFQHLVSSYQSNKNEEAREGMHYASCLAGLAFNLTSLGINHAIAHVVGGKLHIPHGRTNAILLPHVIEYNANIEGYNPSHYTKAAQKYAHLANLLGIGGNTIRISVKNLIHEIERMQRLMNMPNKLTLCKIDQEITNPLRQEIAKAALLDGCIQTNPRISSIQEIVEILHKVT